MTNNEKYLVKLKEVCQKLKVDSDCSQHIIELRKWVEMGAFYAYHTFNELLEMLSSNPKLPEPKKKLILSFLQSIIHGPGNKDSLLSRLYNFIINLKDRPDLTNEFIVICHFKEEPQLTKLHLLIHISEILGRAAVTENHFDIISSNITSFLINHGSDEDLITKQLQSLNRLVAKLIVDKKIEKASEILDATLAVAVDSKKLNLSSESLFEELLTIISNLGKFGTSSAVVMTNNANLTRKIRKESTNDEHKLFLEILTLCFEAASKPIIDHVVLKNLAKSYLKCKDMTGDLVLQKITVLVSKILTHNMGKIEATLEGLCAYHILIVKFFHVFKDIKNKEGVIACCSDLKRHEVFTLILSVFPLVIKLASEGKFNASVARNLLYHLRYGVQIVKEIKCEGKNQEMLKFWNRMYNVIYEFVGKKDMIVENIISLHECIKILFKLWIEIPRDLKTKSVAPENLIARIYQEPHEESSAKICANGLLSLINVALQNGVGYINQSRETKRSSMRSMETLRELLKIIKFDTVSDFMQSKHFDDPKFGGDDVKICEPELLLVEICAIARYAVNEKPEIIAKLFTKLFKSTKDPKILAEACQCICDSTLKVMDINELLCANKLLEAAGNKQFDMEISLALALNNYAIYFTKFETVTNELKKNTTNMIDMIQLQQELDQLKYLNESLRHFTDVVHHIMQHKDDVKRIFSMTRTQTVLNNMQIQYFTRGIKYKDLETFTLLWNLNVIENKSTTTILNIATFFLDYNGLLTDASGNYVKLSKKLKPLTVDEILTHANKVLDELILTFDAQTSSTQGYILSYMLSLWVYFIVLGRKSDGNKRFDQFKALWKSAGFTKDSMFYECIRSKIYFSIVEINLKCFGHCTDNFLSIAVSCALGTKVIDREFAYQFYQIYHRIIQETINYSMNRLVDMDHYESAMLTLIAVATKKGNCLKLFDMLSLAISRHLNMEKTDKAMNLLMDITKLIGLKEEILIESPNKPSTLTTIFDYDSAHLNVRKAAMAPESPIQCELSMIFEDQNTELSRQLESFIHKSSCKCEICNIPQLKFVMFQIGCHYSRLMWLNEKFDVSYRFNSFALEPWRNICDKLRRVMDSEFLMINKSNFFVFSIRWLFQCADTLVKLKMFADVEEIYQEIELINTPNVPDYGCFKQTLYARKENLNFLLERGSEAKFLPAEKKNEPELSFAEFQKFRADKLGKKNSSFKSPELSNSSASSTSSFRTPAPASVKAMRTPAPRSTPASRTKPLTKSLTRTPAAPSAKKAEVIYIDSDDEEPALKKANPEQASKSARKPSAAATPSDLSRKQSARKLKTESKSMEIDLTRDCSSEPTRKTRRRMV